jgi:glycosyltransferase involved in cell wall biosynthesis
MTGRPLRVLHAIHDFLPRHQAGSEIYAASLCRALASTHHVTVLCAEFDPARPHGSVAWRLHDGLPVAEVVNNWAFRGFEETYRPGSLRAALESVLHATAPDVVHVHNLLNLSFELPALARAHGAAVVATLHDYTMVCPSGGQRVHRDEQHVCHRIEPARCARCFRQSPWAARMAAARVGGTIGGGAVAAAARWTTRRMPRLAASAARVASTTMPTTQTDPADILRRLDSARDVLASLDLAVAPSAALARELAPFGLRPEHTIVADYGFAPFGRRAREPRDGPLRIGFAGTLVWHKGAHVLVEAARQLRGDWTLTIAGDAGVFPDYAAALRRLAAGLPVTWTGRFERHEAANVHASFDVLVVPSLWPENSPLVVHEAFMSGVPVVGARTGGIPELVTDGINGLLVEPGDPMSLAAALQRLVDEPALATELGARAPRVRTIDEDAADWDARYRSLAAATRRTA